MHREPIDPPTVNFDMADSLEQQSDKRHNGTKTKFFEQEITLSAHSEPAGHSFPARQAYWTFGDPKNPAVLLPSCYGGRLESTLPILYSSDSTASPPLSTTESPSEETAAALKRCAL